MTPGPVREDKYATQSIARTGGQEFEALESLRDAAHGRAGTGDPVRRRDQGRRRSQAGRVRRFARHSGEVRLPGRLLEFARRHRHGSRCPICCPAIMPSERAGLTLRRDAGRARSGCALGGRRESAARKRRSPRASAFVVVQDMFLTETAQRADVVLPAAIGLRKERHRHQRLRRSAAAEARHLQVMGAKPDLEIIGLIAKEMGVAATIGPVASRHGFRGDPQDVHGYDVPLPVLVDRRRGADRCRSTAASASSRGPI